LALDIATLEAQVGIDNQTLNQAASSYSNALGPTVNQPGVCDSVLFRQDTLWKDRINKVEENARKTEEKLAQKLEELKKPEDECGTGACLNASAVRRQGFSGGAGDLVFGLLENPPPP
jgi:hypothetical protein